MLMASLPLRLQYAPGSQAGVIAPRAELARRALSDSQVGCPGELWLLSTWEVPSTTEKLNFYFHFI